MLQTSHALHGCRNWLAIRRLTISLLTHCTARELIGRKDVPGTVGGNGARVTPKIHFEGEHVYKGLPGPAVRTGSVMFAVLIVLRVVASLGSTCGPAWWPISRHGYLRRGNLELLAARL